MRGKNKKNAITASTNSNNKRTAHPKQADTATHTHTHTRTRTRTQKEGWNTQLLLLVYRVRIVDGTPGNVHHCIWQFTSVAGGA